MGPTLRAMGLDITDSSALLANFETHGENVGRVASTLNATLVSLAKEGFVDPKAALGEFLQQIIDAKDPTEALQLATENFKGNGLIPLVDALQNGVANLADLKDAVANSKGKIDEIAEATKTLGESVTQLKGSITGILAPLGVDLVGALKFATDALKGLIDGPFGLRAAFEGADELDKKFGTSEKDIKAFFGSIADGALSLANVIPGFKDLRDQLKGLSDQTATNKFIDGSMKDGLKTVGDMFTTVAKSTGDAQAKFVDLDKELKTAEANLSAVEKAVRMGVGTDEDAAKARQKVVDVMVKMHPEYKNIFAETDSWNSILKISNDLIGKQDDALLKAAPTISANTALLEAQAISLRARADLWPRDIQGIQDQAAALTDSTYKLNLNYVSMKDLDAIIKGSQDDLKQQENTIRQNTMAFGPLHDAHILGISDLGVLKTRAEESDRAFQNLAANGFDNSRHALEALSTNLRDQINYQIELGNDTTDLQIKLDQTTEALNRQAVGFTDLYKSLQQVIGSDVKNVFHDLEFDISKVGDDFKKLGEDIVSTVTNRIIDAALKPWEDKLSSIITKLSEAAAKSIGLIPSGGVNIPGLPTGGPGTGGIPGIPSVGSMPPTLPGPSGAPPVGAAGGVGSSVSSIMGVVGAVGSAVGAIAGIVGDFQNAHMIDDLKSIELNTRLTAIAMLGAWKTGDQETIFMFTKQTWQAAADFAETLKTTIHGDLVGIWNAVGGGAGASTATAAVADQSIGIINELKNIEGFNWGTLHADLVGIWNEATGIKDNVIAMATKLASSSTSAATAVLGQSPSLSYDSSKMVGNDVASASVVATLNRMAATSGAAGIIDLSSVTTPLKSLVDLVTAGFGRMAEFGSLLHTDLLKIDQLSNIEASIIPQLASVRDAVIMGAQSIIADRQNTPVPIIKVFLDGRELAQSIAVYYSESGTVTPAAA